MNAQAYNCKRKSMGINTSREQAGRQASKKKLVHVIVNCDVEFSMNERMN